MANTLYNKLFSTRNNNNAAPFSILRTGAGPTVQRGVMPEFFEGRLVEAVAGTHKFDVLVPAGATITWLSVYNEVLWSAATSASLEVGDYTNAATPVAIDADGFFTAVDLKAVDLLAGEMLSLVRPGSAEAGVYSAGTGTHWANLYR
ncbi:MAG: hypothetical protein M3Q39_10655, partial [Actinomycetota bacterium]|nr:hypothetical protein [Actinomycetota bacterium]